jgi:DNA-binding transcriptional regulator GbsR (MarR family)
MKILDVMKIPEISVPKEQKTMDKTPNNRNLHEKMPHSLYTGVYLPLKEEFFDLILVTTGSIMPLKKMVARGRIMMELVIEEQYLSKKDIERATGYKSTIIQQVLNELVKLQAVSAKKFENDKKKYYIANNRLLTSSFGKYEGVKRLVKVMIETIQDHLKKTDDDAFRLILQRIQDGYKLYSLYLKQIYYNLEKRDE